MSAGGGGEWREGVSDRAAAATVVTVADVCTSKCAYPVPISTHGVHCASTGGPSFAIDDVELFDVCASI